jgi:hypothetical protein
MGCLHCAGHLSRRDQPQHPGRRSLLASAAPPRRKPTHWTRIDCDYETLRTGMQSLFDDLGITPTAAAAA